MRTEDASFEIDDPKIKAILRALGGELKKDIPPGWGFTLMIFEYGTGQGMFYISSAVREDMIKLLDEFKRKLSE